MGEMCNDCYRAMRNCHDRRICCDMEEYEGEQCDWFEPMQEQEGEG